MQVFLLNVLFNREFISANLFPQGFIPLFNVLCIMEGGLDIGWGDSFGHLGLKLIEGLFLFLITFLLILIYYIG